MAVTEVSTGYGLTISFGGLIAEVVGYQWGGHQRAALDATHADSPNNLMEWVPDDVHDQGELTVDMNLGTQSAPDMAGAPASITFTAKTKSGTRSRTFDKAFLVEYGETVKVKEKNVCQVKIKLAGAKTLS